MNALGKMFEVRASSVLKWIRRYATAHYEQLLENLSRKGFVPIRGEACRVT
jgi:hypothetical protein